MKVKHFSIRTWFIVMLMLFALIPSVTMSLLLIRNVRQDEAKQGIDLGTETVNRMASDIMLLIKEAEQTAELMVVDDSLRIAAETLYAGTDKAHEIELYRSLLRMLGLIQGSSKFSHIRIFYPSSNLITREKYTFFDLNDLDGAIRPEFHRIDSPTTGWTGPYNRYIPGSFVDKQMVTYFREGATLHGSRVIVVAIDIEENEFQAILRQSGGISGSFQLTDEKGKTIASINEHLSSKGTNHTISRTIGSWRLTAQIPLAQFSSNDQEFLLILFVSVLLCVLMIPFLASITAKRPSHELMNLEKSSQAAINGKYAAVPVDATIREVRTLQMAHNAMMDHIGRLIRDVYEAKLLWQEAKTEILAEQIRPHFLYNTLESAKWLAAKNGDDATVNFLEKLAQFYRIGLSEGEDFVPLHQELRHVRLYTELMALRTGQAVFFEQQVPDDVCDVRVMKLLLQPLVENAIEHGILQKPDLAGTISITAKRDQQDLEIVISDDGVGLPPELLERINNNHSSGFGIINVRKRLQYCYGERGTMHYSVNKCGGVTIRIRLSIKPLNRQSNSGHGDSE